MRLFWGVAFSMGGGWLLGQLLVNLGLVAR
jgi:hypothetical protein